MRIAVIGAGIAGNTVAWKLHREHDMTVFEAADWIGGHTHTVDVVAAAGPTRSIPASSSATTGRTRTF